MFCSCNRKITRQLLRAIDQGFHCDRCELPLNPQSANEETVQSPPHRPDTASPPKPLPRSQPSDFDEPLSNHQQRPDISLEDTPQTLPRESPIASPRTTPGDNHILSHSVSPNHSFPFPPDTYQSLFRTYSRAESEANTSELRYPSDFDSNNVSSHEEEIDKNANHQFDNKRPFRFQSQIIDPLDNDSVDENSPHTNQSLQSSSRASTSSLIEVDPTHHEKGSKDLLGQSNQIRPAENWQAERNPETHITGKTEANASITIKQRNQKGKTHTDTSELFTSRLCTSNPSNATKSRQHHRQER